MYGKTSVLGVTIGTGGLASTGFGIAWYVVAASLLIVGGLLLMRWGTGVHPDEVNRDSAVGPARRLRRLAAPTLVLAGIALFAFANVWRGIEAVLTAHAIQLLSGQTTQAVPARHALILYKNTSVQSIFILTSECSVAYLVAALFIGAAPLMLLRSLSPWRTATAVAVATFILIVVNVARLTAIGVTVSKWGRDPGLTIAHTYLGSVLTVIGTCAAGIAFAAVLVGHRASRSAAG